MIYRMLAALFVVFSFICPNTVLAKDIELTLAKDTKVIIAKGTIVTHAQGIKMTISEDSDMTLAGNTDVLASKPGETLPENTGVKLIKDSKVTLGKDAKVTIADDINVTLAKDITVTLAKDTIVAMKEETKPLVQEAARLAAKETLEKIDKTAKDADIKVDNLVDELNDIFSEYENHRDPANSTYKLKWWRILAKKTKFIGDSSYSKNTSRVNTNGALTTDDKGRHHVYTVGLGFEAPLFGLISLSTGDYSAKKAYELLENNIYPDRATLPSLLLYNLKFYSACGYTNDSGICTDQKLEKDITRSGSFNFKVGAKMEVSLDEMFNGGAVSNKKKKTLREIYY